MSSGRCMRWPARWRRERGVDSSRARSVVVGMPGVVDPADRAPSRWPPTSAASRTSARRATLAELFGSPVVIENDVNLAMLGEAWQGCAQGAQNAAFLALGTGVGLGLIVNGQLARGATGAAGEIAYLPIGATIWIPRRRARSARSSSKSAARASCATTARGFGEGRQRSRGV